MTGKQTVKRLPIRFNYFFTDISRSWDDLSVSRQTCTDTQVAVQLRQMTAFRVINRCRDQSKSYDSNNAAITTFCLLI
jgi:hypothetical protein